MENLPQQQASEGLSAASPPAPAPRKPPVVRMNKSLDYATVHGDMVPGDPDMLVRFVQDGLPFDANGKLLLNHHSIQGDERLQKKVEKLLLQAMKRQAANPGDADPEDRDEIEENLDDTFADDDDDDKRPLELAAWAAGTEQYPWQDITNAIASRYAKRVMNKKGALELLIEERVVSAGALSKAHRRLLQD